MILIPSVDSASVAHARDVKAAVIPVIELTRAIRTSSDEAAAVRYGYVTFCLHVRGKQMAAIVVADGGDKASAAIYNLPGLVVSEAMAAFKDEMTLLCPDALCPPSMLIRPVGKTCSL